MTNAWRMATLYTNYIDELCIVFSPNVKDSRPFGYLKIDYIFLFNTICISQPKALYAITGNFFRSSIHGFSFFLKNQYQWGLII